MTNLLRRRVTTAAAVILVALVLPAWAFGQCTPNIPASPWDPRKPYTEAVRLELLGCLGGPLDMVAVATETRQALDVPRDETDLFRPAAASALANLSIYADGLKARHAVFTELNAQAALARASLGTRHPAALPESWVLDPVTQRVPVTSLQLQAHVDSACAMQSPGCTTAFDVAADVLRVAHLAKTALDLVDLPNLQGHLEAMNRRATSWDEYFSKARSQYLWELVLNGALMADDRPVVGGTQRGFRSVPSSQVMLLHPTVAFEYAQDEPEGNRFAGTVVVDVIGYNKWRWKADGSMGFAVGASLIVAVADHAAMDDVGWGGMLHINNQWSVGVIVGKEKTTSERQTAIMVSGDVAQLWTKVSELRKRRLMTAK